MSVKNKKREYDIQEKMSIVGFLFEIPFFVILGASSIISGSVLVWLDFLDALCYLIQTSFVVYISRMLKKDLAYQYNYGVKRLEILTSLFCDFLLCFGAMCIAIVSVYYLVNPERPSDFLVYVVALKFLEMLIDSVLLFGQYRLINENSGALIKTEFSMALRDLLNDSAMLILIIICYYFRDNKITWYFSSIASMAMSLLYIYSRKQDIKENIKNLVDKTLEEKLQLRILKCLNSHNDLYEKFFSIDSRQLGNTVFIDFNLGFPDNTTYEEIIDLRNTLEKEINDEFKEEHNNKAKKKKKKQIDEEIQLQVSIVINGKG